MPTSPLPDELKAFLAEPNPSVIATVTPEGDPHSAATWYLRRDPHVSLTVVGKDDWYHQVTLLGTAVEIADDEDLAGIDRLCRHYMGGDYSNRDDRRVNAWIEIDSWYGWSGGSYWSG
jgi:hypothetical protein